MRKNALDSRIKLYVRNQYDAPLRGSKGKSVRIYVPQRDARRINISAIGTLAANAPSGIAQRGNIKVWVREITCRIFSQPIFAKPKGYAAERARRIAGSTYHS